MNSVLFLIKYILFNVFSLFSSRKVAVLRDRKEGLSFIYKSPEESTIEVLNESGDHFNRELETLEKGVGYKKLAGNLELYVVELNQLEDSKTITRQEKWMIAHAFIDKKMTLITH